MKPLALMDPEPNFNIFLFRKGLETILPTELVFHVMHYVHKPTDFVDAVLHLSKCFQYVFPEMAGEKGICYRVTSRDSEEHIGQMGKVKVDRRRNTYIKKDGRRIYGLFLHAKYYSRQQRKVVSEAVRDTTWRKIDARRRVFIGLPNGSFFEHDPNKSLNGYGFREMQDNCIACYIAGHSLKSLTFDRALDMALYVSTSEVPLLLLMYGSLHNSRWSQIPVCLLARKRIVCWLHKIVQKSKKTILKSRFSDYLRRGYEANIIPHSDYVWLKKKD